MRKFISWMMWTHMKWRFRNVWIEDNNQNCPLTLVLFTYGIAHNAKRLTQTSLSTAQHAVNLCSSKSIATVIQSTCYPEFAAEEKKYREQLFKAKGLDVKLHFVIDGEETLVSTFSESKLITQVLKNLGADKIVLVADKEHMPRVVLSLMHRMPNLKILVNPVDSVTPERHRSVPCWKGLNNHPLIWIWWHSVMYTLSSFKRLPKT